jgi:hypothetical protein
VKKCFKMYFGKIFFFFFFICPRKGRGRGIQTCDLRFIRRSLQPIELPLGDIFR